MFNQEEQITLLELVRKEKNHAWGYSAEETPYIEKLNDLQTKIEDLDCPRCEACNDTGEVWSSQEDEEGRDIDILLKCNCKI